MVLEQGLNLALDFGALDAVSVAQSWHRACEVQGVHEANPKNSYLVPGPIRVGCPHAFLLFSNPRLLVDTGLIVGLVAAFVGNDTPTSLGDRLR